MLFADDIVLVDDSKAGVNSKLKQWGGALESRGFRLSRSKIEYVEFVFGGASEGGGDMMLGEDCIPEKESFRYLGSLLQREGGIDADIKH